MEAMLVIFGAALLALSAVLVSLLRVRGTCAGTCEHLGRLACEGCPRLAHPRERDREQRDASA